MLDQRPRETTPLTQQFVQAVRNQLSTRWFRFLDIDHIYPKAKGGAGSPPNGQVLCNTCNLIKSDKLPGEN